MRVRRLATMILLAVLPCACATARPASAPARTGALVGVVRAADTDAPVPGVTVRVVGQRVGAQTDSLGRYRIAGVRATAAEGTLFVEAARIGYYRERSELPVYAGATGTLDFRLRPKPVRLVK